MAAGAVLAAGGAWMAWAWPREDAALIASVWRDALDLGPSLAVNAARALAALALAVTILLLHAAAGRRLLRWGRATRGGIAPAAPLLAAALLGLALLGLAACGLWYPSVLIVLAAAWAGAGARDAAAVVRDGAGFARAAWGAAPGWARALLAASCVWWLPLLAPPEAYGDSLVYHLTVPQQFLLTHRLFGTHVPGTWTMPLLFDLAHAYPLLLGLDAACRLVSAGLGVAGALAFLRAATRVPPAAALAAVALAFLLPRAAWVTATAKNDVPAAGAALAAAAAVLASGALRGAVRRPGALALAGVLAGASVAGKYTGLPFALLLGAAVAWRLKPAARPGALALGAAAFLAPLLPWLAKTWVLLGDPLYPFGQLMFPGTFGAPESAEAVRTMVRVSLRDLRPGALVPLDAAQVAGASAFPLAAAWLAAGALPAGPVLAASAAGFVGQLAAARMELVHIERYAYATLVLWNLAAWGALLGARRRLRWLPAAACVLALAAQARLYHWIEYRRPGAYLGGRLDADGYRRDAMAGYGAFLPALRATVAAAPPNGTILSLGEVFAWDAGRRVLAAEYEPPPPWTLTRGARSPERVAVGFRQLGIRWILYNSVHAGFERFRYSPYDWTPDQLARYAAFARRRYRVMGFGGRVDDFTGGTWLFAVASRPGERPGALPFLPGAERALAFASLAQLHGARDDAIARYRAYRTRAPGILQGDSLLGGALLEAGRPAEAYPLLRRSADAGYVDDRNLLDLAVAAARTGRRAEAEAALARAAAVYPRGGDRIAALKRTMNLR